MNGDVLRCSVDMIYKGWAHHEVVKQHTPVELVHKIASVLLRLLEKGLNSADSKRYISPGLYLGSSWCT